MKSEWIISLPGIKIRAFHGIHDFEKEKGNDFIVSINARPKSGGEKPADLSSTIDYENLYKIVQEEMKVTSELMEEVAKRIGERILLEHQNCQELEVSISKLAPQTMPGSTEAKVTLLLSR